jgi:hypothetical protein
MPRPLQPVAGPRQLSPPQQAPAPDGSGILSDVADTASDFMHGGAQGATFNFGDEIQGGIQALLRKYVQGSDADARASLGDLYRKERDAARNENDIAKKRSPKAFFLGEMAGGVPMAMATGGAGTAPRLATLVKTGMAMGAATGLGGSEADLTQGNVGGAAADTALGAGVGGATAAVMPSLLKLAGRAASGVAKKADEMFIDRGRKVLQGGSTLTGQGKKAISPEAVRAAGDVGAFKPLGNTQGAYEKVDAARGAVGDIYGRIVKSLEANGIKGPKAQALAQELASGGRLAEMDTMNAAVPQVWRENAERLTASRQLPSGATQDIIPKDAAGHLSLTRAENLKRSLQQQAKYNRLNLAETEQNEARKGVASTIRQGVEDEIAQQMPGASPQVQAIGSMFVPVKKQLGLLIEAGDAAEKAASQQMKRTNSLHHAVAMGPALAHGNLLAAAKAAGAESLIRNRGPSTTAWASRKVARAIPWLRQRALVQALQEPAAPLLAGEAVTDQLVGQ